MKYLKTFENIDNENFRNEILIIDASGSFLPYISSILKNVNLYLKKRFITFFCTGFDMIKHENVTIEDVLKIAKQIRNGGGDNIQDAINYIVKEKLKGSILIISDGGNTINLKYLKNDVAYLRCIENFKPYILPPDKCKLFYNNLESLDQFYPPRDITYSNYEFKVTMKNYNL